MYFSLNHIKQIIRILILDFIILNKQLEKTRVTCFIVGSVINLETFSDFMQIIRVFRSFLTIFSAAFKDFLFLTCVKNGSCSILFMKKKNINVPFDIYEVFEKRCL